MKFSIITATHNSEASIADTQRSIAEQDIDRNQIEWIVVDGASTDGTLARISEQAFQPDQLVSEPDIGIYDALNKGVRMATGDVIGFLHADDFLASTDVLSRLARAFHSSETEAVYGDLQYIRPMDGGGFGVVRYWESGTFSLRKLKWGWMPPHPALYLKRSIYERAVQKNGEFFDRSFTCAADYDFMLRIFSRYDVVPIYLPMVLVKMRMGGVSNRGLGNVIQKSKEDWRAIRRNQIGHIQTLIWKNVSKLGQFVKR